MQKDKLNFIVAIVIILTAFLGFPKSLKNIIFVISALVILIPALRDIRKEIRRKAESEFKDTFVESKPKEVKQENPLKSPHIADA